MRIAKATGPAVCPALTRTGYPIRVSSRSTGAPFVRSRPWAAWRTTGWAQRKYSPGASPSITNSPFSSLNAPTRFQSGSSLPTGSAQMWTHGAGSPPARSEPEISPVPARQPGAGRSSEAATMSSAEMNGRSVRAMP